jgi:hypothetical protein
MVAAEFSAHVTGQTFAHFCADLYRVLWESHPMWPPELLHHGCKKDQPIFQPISSSGQFRFYGFQKFRK